jgi:hypothetical protein
MHLTAHFDAATEISERLRLIEFCVEVLIRQTKIGKIWVEGFEETSSLLETLPSAAIKERPRLLPTRRIRCRRI